MTLEQLLASVPKLDCHVVGPYLRRYRGRDWTCATNGYALVAVQGRLTDQTGGPTATLQQLCPVDMRRSVALDLAALRKFLGRCHRGTVGVANVALQRHVLQSAVAHLPSRRVLVRASHGPSHGVLRIDGDGFIVLCVGVSGDLPPEPARFP